MKNLRFVLLLGAVCAVLSPLRGVETAFWQIGTFNEFLQGTLTGVSLSKDGELMLAPEAHVVFHPEEALALSLAYDTMRKSLYVGTGHQGKVFRVQDNQNASVVFQAQEPDIFALAVGPDSALYVASSPEGKIYRVTPDGKSKVFYDPNTKYIWSLLFDAQGRLYAGTGDRGQVLRIDASGKGEIFFDSKQTHIMCLSLDRQGNVLAGSVPNGLIFRITPQGKAFALYQASFPEIHDLTTDAQGRIYAATLGSEAGKGTPELFVAPPAPGGGRPTATVTVTTSEDSGSRAANAQNPPAVAPTSPSFNRTGPAALGFPAPQGFKGRGSLIEIRPDSTVQTVWSSNSESIFGLAARNNHILFSTDSNGRVFDLDPASERGKLTLLTETHESLATRLLLESGNLFIATSNAAKILLLGATPSREGSFQSPVKDTKMISRWGVLAWRAEVSPGATLEFYTRSGNSDRPDATWSDWAGPYRNANGSAIQSPPARYLQWKVAFRGTGTTSPILDDVTVAYLNQNLAPEIRSITVSTASERTSAASVGPSAPMNPSVSLAVSASPPASFGPGPVPGPSGKVPITVSWQADDPNGDPLVYSLFVKATDEEQWHLLKDKLRQTSYTLDPSTLADGKYSARLVASDEDSNAPETALRTEMISAPFWIDNTPPQVRVAESRMTAEGVVVRFEVEDRTSPLRNAEVAIDNQEWRNVLPDDGIIDNRVEIFTVKPRKLEAGEHVVSLRAYDTAGNVGVGKAVVRIPGTPGPPR